jgi:hypothetical protein
MKMPLALGATGFLKNQWDDFTKHDSRLFMGNPGCQKKIHDPPQMWRKLWEEFGN